MSRLFESGGQLLIYVLLFATPWTVSPPGSSVHGILQARILEWLPYPSLEDLPNLGIEPGPPALQTEILGSVFFPQLVREIKNLNV